MWILKTKKPKNDAFTPMGWAMAVGNNRPLFLSRLKMDNITFVIVMALLGIATATTLKVGSVTPFAYGLIIILLMLILGEIRELKQDYRIIQYTKTTTTTKGE